MPERGEYQFDIDAFTPLSLPMKRLYEYMADLIDLFAHEDHVHFLRVDEGSAKPSVMVDSHVVAKVERRLMAVAAASASARAMAAYTSLNDKLFDDDAVAELTGPNGKILHFPGRERVFSPEIGPLVETGVL